MENQERIGRRPILERSIGKDTWFLVNINHTSTNERILTWIRVIDVTDTTYVVNEAKNFYFNKDIDTFPRDYRGDMDTKDKILSETRTYLKTDIDLVNPIEACITEELFEKQS